MSHLEQSLSDASPTPIARFLAHSFESDAEYQQGMAGILGSGLLEGKTDEERSELLLRSEVFYFNRVTGSSITVDEAREARSAQSPSVPDSSPASVVLPSDPVREQEEPKTLTFAQLKELIEQGRTDEIPNNKVIPNVLSSEAPSESKAEVRRKPWEIKEIKEP